MSKLKVVFVPTNVSGVNFWRVWQPAQFLKKIDVQAKVMWYGHDGVLMHPWEIDLLKEEHGPEIQSQLLKACEWADIVVWMALHTPQSFEVWQALKWQFDRKPFLMEIDDYIYSIPHGNIASKVYIPGTDIVKIFTDQMRASDGVIVSTPFLANLYRDINNSIDIVENGIDFNLWRRNFHSPGRQGLTIGWVGGGSHTPDLEMIKGAMFRVLENNKQCVFKCVHGCPEFFKHHDRIHWTHEFKDINKYPEWVASFGFDIGIAPLVDNNFNRGKSNLRFQEYSALKIPSVCSPLPHFRQTIEHGRNGFLAETEEDWVKYLELLIRDVDLRKHMGEEAYKDVFSKFNIKDMAVKYKTILQERLNASTYKTDPSVQDWGFDRRSKQPALDGI